jgi:4-oxalocrotonate tautomerase
MPHVQITLLEGRSQEQKRRLAERITDVIVEEAGARKEAVSIAFIEVPPTDFAREGVLLADRKSTG